MHSYVQCVLTYTFSPASRDLISPQVEALRANREDFEMVVV